MSHRRFLEDQIIALLGNSSRCLNPWHSENELEDLLVQRGYDRDLVQEVLDSLINNGWIDFTLDDVTGDCLLSPPTDPAYCLPSVR